MDQSNPNNRLTQRRLILIRHAKAVEDDPAGDHARPLNERGRKDAEALAGWLQQQGLAPDLVLCSTANRTRETLSILSQKRNWPTILTDKLYLASSGEMLNLIQSTDAAVNTVLVLCHNPGAHALLALLVGSYAQESDGDKLLLKFPTSACAVIDYQAENWRGILPNRGHLAHLRY